MWTGFHESPCDSASFLSPCGSAESELTAATKAAKGLYVLSDRYDEVRVVVAGWFVEDEVAKGLYEDSEKREDDVVVVVVVVGL